MAVRGKTFRLPKKVPIDVIQKALAEKRNFEEFLMLAYGPQALGPKAIRLTADHLTFSRTVLLESGADEEDGEDESKHARRYANLVPVLLTWFRESPRIAKAFETFTTFKLTTVNGNGDLTTSILTTAPVRSEGGLALRAKAITRWRYIFETGKKKCSKCGRIKTFDEFRKEKNPYYPEVGEPMRPSVWCISCTQKHSTASSRKARKKD